jgi:hypothetical protein
VSIWDSDRLGSFQVKAAIAAALTFERNELSLTLNPWSVAFNFLTLMLWIGGKIVLDPGLKADADKAGR